MADMGVKNFAVVAETLWRGGRPDAGAAERLADAGVRTVVNLELLHSDDNAFWIPGATGIKLERIRGWEPDVVVAPWLALRHVNRFLAMVRDTNGTVYVHCRDGQNRTGLMVAAYRMVYQGWAAWDAIFEMQSFKGAWASQNRDFILGHGHRFK